MMTAEQLSVEIDILENRVDALTDQVTILLNLVTELQSKLAKIIEEDSNNG